MHRYPGVTGQREAPPLTRQSPIDSSTPPALAVGAHEPLVERVARQKALVEHRLVRFGHDLAEAVVSLGRDAANTIRLHDTEVSRRHAEVRRILDGHELVDISSANGTFINDRRVRRAELHAGDHIVIGQSVLLYSTGRDESS